VRVSAQPRLGQIENVDLAAGLGDLVEEAVVVLPDLRQRESSAMLSPKTGPRA